ATALYMAALGRKLPLYYSSTLNYEELCSILSFGGRCGCFGAMDYTPRVDPPTPHPPPHPSWPRAPYGPYRPSAWSGRARGRSGSSVECKDLDMEPATACVDMNLDCGDAFVQKMCRKTCGLCSPAPSGRIILFLSGSDACQFRRMDICTEQGNLLNVDTATISHLDRCIKRENYLDCIQNDRDQELCPPGYEINGDIEWLRDQIRPLLVGSLTDPPCVFNLPDP
ncbi:unnamed protein product, partial [Meganyctiphanes norvegica]